VAISQGSNRINVVVHNRAGSRNASPSATILSRVLVEEQNPPVPDRPATSFLRVSCSGMLVTRRAAERRRGGGRTREV